MRCYENTFFLEKVKSQGDTKKAPGIGPISNTLPKTSKPVFNEDLDIGVSTHYAHSSTLNPITINDQPHWYALRATYGREKKAYEFIKKQGVTVFYPTIKTVRLVNGKRKIVEESRFPNMFFAFGTESEIKSLVYDNVNLPFLRFYYRYFLTGNTAEKEPLIVPNHQMETLRIICQAEDDNTIFMNSNIEKFRTGQLVKIIEGKFKGVVGVVARYKGQQRVGIIIDGFLTAVTAYIPSAFIKAVD